MNTELHVGNNSCSCYIAYPSKRIGGDASKWDPVFLLRLHDVGLDNKNPISYTLGLLYIHCT